MKRPKPVTACTICGAPGYNITLVEHERCRREGCKEASKALSVTLTGANVLPAALQVGIAIRHAANVKALVGCSFAAESPRCPTPISKSNERQAIILDGKELFLKECAKCDAEFYGQKEETRCEKCRKRKKNDWLSSEYVESGDGM
jgi:hypothetical protein